MELNVLLQKFTVDLIYVMFSGIKLGGSQMTNLLCDDIAICKYIDGFSDKLYSKTKKATSYDCWEDIRINGHIRLNMAMNSVVGGYIDTLLDAEITKLSD